MHTAQTGIEGHLTNFKGLTAIYVSTYTYYMLFERQGWAKSSSNNVAKA
jgi:hypothetical protein